MIKPKFKIIETKPKQTFAQSLESKAGRIVSKENKAEHGYLSSGLEKQISLTIFHIQDLRTLHHNLRRNIQYQESGIDLELMRMNRTKYPVWILSYQERRDKLKEQLRELGKESRRLAMQKVSAMQPLHDHLLNLLEKRSALNPET